MIGIEHHQNRGVAEQLLAVQLPAYRIEADIIGFWDIPPLRDTAETIMKSSETFVGYRLDGALAGFISFEDEGDARDICRMVVHPDYFRRGIAKSLLAYVLEDAGKHKKVKVSTGAKNEPAIALYRSFGFVDAGAIEIAPEVKLALFELPAIRQ
ncbi:GNAT family N-acetyltransferase [Paenibacillus sp. 1011MAR3C5]|uniref:GNAT family N-acetyltransferase n=1 Tax=Paenibacillus sp. 1011MAR3C5 TaxID=1675787 RepID=UPI000E6BF298|nr:GNAT family N-acetyltransferase [Paenibacillus sp. 1011MAR3C5]RJE87502.1 GNAT family N-acetyltransferase [Paenibacillus sp. 1011MAR3C5]